MELNLARFDYMKVGATLPRCMEVLPTATESAQKVVVGDIDGVLTCFNMKKREPNIFFKTLPGVHSIRNVRTGGAVGSMHDKIFSSCGSEVKGYSKKGKQFLSFETNFTDPVKSMHVNGVDLLVTTDYIYSHFQDCQDSNYYVSSELINDVCALNQAHSGKLVPVLACQDRVLRVLQDSDMDFEIEIPGVPSHIKLSGNQGGDHGDEVVYGTQDGHIGLLQVAQDGPPRHGWEIGNTKFYGGISSLGFQDVIGDGVLDLLVGRDDGIIQVFGFDDTDEPVLRFEQQLPESVAAVSGGRVLNPNYDEVVVSTYAGWVMGMTTEPLHRNLLPHGSLNSGVEANEKMLSLKGEIDSLNKKVLAEREKYQRSANDDRAFSTIQTFDVNDKFQLKREDASYQLSLEVQMSIDNVLLQSDVPVDLLDVEKNSAVVSYSAVDENNDNFLLVTYRCQSNTTRLDLKIRTIEGQYGTLRAYVIPKIQPKMCQVKEYQIKPLSLHSRIHDEISPDIPTNSLTLTGSFSLSEVHSWVRYCLPDVPERPPADDQISYKYGEAVFRSDNVSTIAIVKDVLSKLATESKIALSINYDVTDASIPHILSLIDIKLEYQLDLAKRVQLIEPLMDIKAQENGDMFMSPEYRDILRQADTLKLEFRRQPGCLERLYGMIADLFIDKYKFKGINVKNKTPVLMELLNSNYDLVRLMDYFHNAVEV